MAESVTITGLKELIAATRRIDRGAANEMRKELRTTVGAAFVEDVRGRLGWSREIPGTIKPTIRGNDLIIVSRPPIRPGPRSGQGFQAIYEFAPRWKGRSFMRPTLEKWQAGGILEQKMNTYLDWVEKEFTK